eukprot:Lankesteria_metandrocarpae@DN5368_c0_g1_i4.p1
MNVASRSSDKEEAELASHRRLFKRSSSSSSECGVGYDIVNDVEDHLSNSSGDISLDNRRISRGHRSCSLCNQNLKKTHDLIGLWKDAEAKLSSVQSDNVWLSKKGADLMKTNSFYYERCSVLETRLSTADEQLCQAQRLLTCYFTSLADVHDQFNDSVDDLYQYLGCNRRVTPALMDLLAEKWTKNQLKQRLSEVSAAGGHTIGSVEEKMNLCEHPIIRKLFQVLETHPSATALNRENEPAGENTRPLRFPSAGAAPHEDQGNHVDKRTMDSSENAKTDSGTASVRKSSRVTFSEAIEESVASLDTIGGGNADTFPAKSEMRTSFVIEQNTDDPLLYLPSRSVAAPPASASCTVGPLSVTALPVIAATISSNPTSRRVSRRPVHTASRTHSKRTPSQVPSPIDQSLRKPPECEPSTPGALGADSSPHRNDLCVRSVAVVSKRRMASEFRGVELAPPSGVATVKIHPTIDPSLSSATIKKVATLEDAPRSARRNETGEESKPLAWVNGLPRLPLTATLLPTEHELSIPESTLHSPSTLQSPLSTMLVDTSRRTVYGESTASSINRNQGPLRTVSVIDKLGALVRGATGANIKPLVANFTSRTNAQHEHPGTTRTSASDTPAVVRLIANTEPVSCKYDITNDERAFTVGTPVSLSPLPTLYKLPEANSQNPSSALGNVTTSDTGQVLQSLSSGGTISYFYTNGSSRIKSVESAPTLQRLLHAGATPHIGPIASRLPHLHDPNIDVQSFCIVPGAATVREAAYTEKVKGKCAQQGNKFSGAGMQNSPHVRDDSYSDATAQSASNRAGTLNMVEQLVRLDLRTAPSLTLSPDALSTAKIRRQTAPQSQLSLRPKIQEPQGPLRVGAVGEDSQNCPAGRRSGITKVKAKAAPPQEKAATTYLSGVTPPSLLCDQNQDQLKGLISTVGLQAALVKHHEPTEPITHDLHSTVSPLRREALLKGMAVPWACDSQKPSASTQTTFTVAKQVSDRNQSSLTINCLAEERTVPPSPNKIPFTTAPTSYLPNTSPQSGEVSPTGSNRLRFRTQYITTTNSGGSIPIQNPVLTKVTTGQYMVDSVVGGESRVRNTAYGFVMDRKTVIPGQRLRAIDKGNNRDFPNAAQKSAWLSAKFNRASSTQAVQRLNGYTSGQRGRVSSAGKVDASRTKNFSPNEPTKVTKVNPSQKSNVVNYTWQTIAPRHHASSFPPSALTSRVGRVQGHNPPREFQEFKLMDGGANVWCGHKKSHSGANRDKDTGVFKSLRERHSTAGGYISQVSHRHQSTEKTRPFSTEKMLQASPLVIYRRGTRRVDAQTLRTGKTVDVNNLVVKRATSQQCTYRECGVMPWPTYRRNHRVAGREGRTYATTAKE